MAFNNFWILVLILPLIFLVIADIIGGGKELVFPVANSKIKKHNYSRLNYGNQRIKYALFIFGFFFLIISAAGMFFFYSKLGLQGTHLGVILAHAALGTPFVVITVTATLSGFDNDLIRASQSLGATPTTTFFKVIVPLITPGVISGALFAFVTSFDEVVVVLFVGSYKQRTIPWQMFSGIREQISPTILSAATLLIIITIALLTTIEFLRRRTERIRGITNS